MSQRNKISSRAFAEELKRLGENELRALRDRVDQELAARRFEERLMWEVRRQGRSSASVG